MKEDNDIKITGSKIDRRRFLQGIGSSALVGGFAGLSSAAERTITVSQGSEEYEISPVQADMTVQEFYSYNDPSGASANTPYNLEDTETAQLFFYEGPNGLSLVTIFDKPSNNNGGSISYEFNALPTSGSWVIKDDSGDNYSQNYAHWKWYSCCTDGGVFRGGLETGFEFTLSPSVDYGIDTWQLVSGSGEDLEFIDIDLSKDITVNIGEGGRPSEGDLISEFEDLREAKLEMANQIESVSQSINERSRVEQTLDNYRNGIENGNIDPQTAINGVERHILAEDLTELSLGGLSPVSVTTPEDSESQVGEPADSPAAKEEFDIAGEFVEKGALFATAGLLALRGLRSISSWLSSAIPRFSKFLDYLERGIQIVYGAVPFADDFLAPVVSEQVDFAEEEMARTGEAFDAVTQRIQEEVRGPVADLVMRRVEEDFEGGIDSLDDQLSVDETGSLNLEGDNEGARQAATAGREEIIDVLETQHQKLKVAGYMSMIGNLIALGGLATSATGIGAAAAIVGGFFSISFDLLGWVSAASALTNVSSIHYHRLGSIADGGGY